MEDHTPAFGKMDALMAMRRVERLGRGRAVEAVLGVGDSGWLPRAWFDVIGIYRFPSEEVPGLDWPGLVLHATLEREGEDSLEAWFAVYPDADGDLCAVPISGLPAADRLLQARREAGV